MDQYIQLYSAKKSDKKVTFLNTSITKEEFLFHHTQFMNIFGMY